MKSLLRSSIVAGILGRLIWVWMALVSRTVRWTVEVHPEARQAWRDYDGVVVASWHSRILLLPAGWIRFIRGWKDRVNRAAMLISLSPDGEAVARAIDHLGLHAIRGSAGNKKKKNKDKGGARAIAEASRLLKTGTAVCITPDGPRGPAERVSPGAIMIAQRAGAPIVPYALSVSGARRLNTWDRFIIPFPFTRGAIVLGPPIATPRTADPELLQAELQERLDAATRRADMLAGLAITDSRTDPAPR
ncbi:MAG TPA: lysophospholipid acyltransferase family protein [Hyphomonas sp.]|nr:lysophospholipid acyltransferase family protein [Hyphomonas sp.]HRX73908.1 lysophospholipid acyltransferase family protein [Hyphomonas sp.]